MSNPFTYANKVRKKFKDPYWVAKNKYITDRRKSDTA